MTEEQQSQHPLSRAPLERVGRRASAAQRARALAQKQADAMPAVAPYDGPRRERVVTGELKSPAPTGGLLGVIQQPYLLKLLVRREIARMYAASVLGLLWSYIQPAIRFSVYYFVFGILLSVHKSVPNFAIHLFCGIVFVHYFSETFSGGTRSIWQNSGLVKKMSMPREIFPVAQMFVGLYHTLPQVLLLMVLCVSSGFSGDATGIISGLLGFAIVATFAGALALLFSAVNVYYRDFQNIVGTITQFMHFVVPMMYPFARVLKYAPHHPVFYQIYMANPVADGVILLQRFFWEGVNKHDGVSNANTVFPAHMLTRGWITLVVCIFLLWVCQRVFSRLESRFPERL
ncbi:MAG: ABC transporter permease [Actinomycetota bacterium]|nr:ABC transporter permease [Actinomycetota bacterium]